MMQFPLNSNAMLCVIEPRNLKPLLISLPNGSEVIVFWTPDIMKLQELLGLQPMEPPEGRVIAKQVKISSDQLSTALQFALDFPEVER